MNELAKRHHTVPRFYLEGFAAAGQIGAARLENAARLTLSVKKAATSNAFYMLKDDDGRPTDVF